MDFNTLFAAAGEATEVFTPQDVLVTIFMSFILTLIIGKVYQITHRGVAYSQSYVHTLVLMSMVVAIIMLVIGSNIARAFTLVGALSIVRFRNAIKETRDVGFVFFAMGIGMACGTRFYTLAVIATLVICFLLWAMVRFDFFGRQSTPMLLKVRLGSDLPYANFFEDIFDRYLTRYELIALETVQAGTLTELVYNVELKRGADPQAMLHELSERNGNQKVALITGQQETDL
jgi:hypothetical protein